MDANTFIEHYFEQQRARTAQMPFKLAAILDAARTMGLIEIHIAYDGMGDEGNIDEISGFKPSNRDAQVDLAGAIPCDPVDLTAPQIITVGDRTYQALNDLIEDYGWDIINTQHGGFEINDGGFGEILITVATGKVKLDMSNRFMSHDTTEVEVA
ncbi:DUF6878 family protein [Hyphomicrobium sp. DY-1]|uniref:DUF6878 family protein n=1 Tax=Hyphomicrobium sp. DY-1 TaxID=3075650 RepID=UPI0039C2E863